MTECAAVFPVIDCWHLGGGPGWLGRCKYAQCPLGPQLCTYRSVQRGHGRCMTQLLFHRPRQDAKPRIPAQKQKSRKERSCDAHVLPGDDARRLAGVKTQVGRRGNPRDAADVGCKIEGVTVVGLPRPSAKTGPQVECCGVDRQGQTGRGAACTRA